MKLRNQEIYGLAPFSHENYKYDKSSARPKLFESLIITQVFDWYSSDAYSYLQISKKGIEDYKMQKHKV
jgi:hypothetical protein